MNTLSKEAIHILKSCWENGERRVIVITIDGFYYMNTKKFKFTEKLLEEIKNTHRVKVWYGGSKTYNIMGLEGRSKK